MHGDIVLTMGQYTTNDLCFCVCLCVVGVVYNTIPNFRKTQMASTKKCVTFMFCVFVFGSVYSVINNTIGVQCVVQCNMLMLCSW